MIQWHTTLAPQTTASSSSSSSNSVSYSYTGAETTFSSSYSSSESSSRSASWDWWHTESASGLSWASETGRTSTLKDSDGNVTSVQTADTSGSDSSSQSTLLTLTNFRNKQTSTTVSHPDNVYDPFCKITTETYAAQAATTSSYSDQTFAWTVPTVSTRLTTTSSSRRTIELASTTTLADTELDPSFYATIYQTSRPQNNEVIWFLDTFASEIFDGNYSAASEHAQSGTRFTALPWSKTVQATARSSILSSSFDGTTVSNSFVMTLATTTQEASVYPIGDFDSLPMETFTNYFRKHTTTTTTTQTSLVFESVSVVGSSISISKNGWFQCLTRTTVFANVTHTQDALWSSLTRSTYRTIATVLTTASTSETTSAAGSTYQSESAISRAAKVYAEAPRGVEISFQNLEYIDRNQTFAPRGVMNGANQLALWYDSPVSIQNIGRSNIYAGIFQNQSRAISTVFPTTFTFSNNDVEQTGVLSVRGLLCSATSINVNDSAASETTTSFVLQPAGQTYLIQEINASPGFNGGQLGERETAVFSIHPGVYRAFDSNGSTSTFSTTGEIRSWTGSSETRFLQGLSYLVPGAEMVVPLVWSTTTASFSLFNPESVSLGFYR